MATANEPTENGLREQALQYTLAANPLVGIRDQEIWDSAGKLFEQIAINPTLAAKHYMSYIGELGRIASGDCALIPDAKDKRFADPAWKDSASYRTLVQSYLAFSAALNGFVDEAKMDKLDAERSRFIISLYVDAMAPTNLLAGNPAAVKRFVDTGGASLVRGFQNFSGDLAANGGLPAQVDARQFAVGENLATTPGIVVYRSPVMELIQYKPMTSEVHARPLLIAPPQINKFYVFDLVPEKSIIRYALKGGLQTFAISWKNPSAAESHFGLETYVAALEEAVDVMREITGSPDVNIWGSCSGGITMSAFLANLAARGERKVHSATVAVCVLDMVAAKTTTAGLFTTKESTAAAKHASQTVGVLEGRELARMFAWMRPNDLIWNYWVNNYLLGNDPPAYDILYWNNDTARLPAQLHADFLGLIDTNPYVEPGRMAIGGHPIDMRKVDIDSYVVAGVTDHITPWQGCYETAKLYGDRSTFVLANSGHIQSLINPPGNKKAFFWAAAAQQDGAEAWLAQATKTQGSWWPHWLEWIAARSGETKPAPPALGTAGLPALGDAPGRYVMES
jgi:poly[(R)-3-hydroxyalkanoate] polymerase subunit PhaC